MKTLSSIAVTLSFLAFHALAQPADVGFLRIVHVVAQGSGKASIFLNDRDLHPAGYELGQDTGGYGVHAGDLRIRVGKNGVESGSTLIRLKAGETATILAYAEHIPEDRADDAPRWKIKFLRLPPQDAEGIYRLSFVSLCRSEQTPVSLSVEGQTHVRVISAARLAITKMETGPKATEIAVSTGNQKLTHISTDAPGNYVVILYENAEGKVQALSFYDAKFTVAG